MFTRAVGLIMDDNGFRRIQFRVTGRIKEGAFDASVAKGGARWRIASSQSFRGNFP